MRERVARGVDVVVTRRNTNVTDPLAKVDLLLGERHGEPADVDDIMFARSLFLSLARSLFHMQRHTHADTHRRTQIDAGTHRQSRTHAHTLMHTHTQGVFCGGITIQPQGRGGERGLWVDTCGKFSRKRTLRPSTCAPTIIANLSLLPYCSHAQPQTVEATWLGCRGGQVILSQM